MASLLDRVLDFKDNPSSETQLSPSGDTPHQIEDGVIIYDSTIAALNRIFELNPHLYRKRQPNGVYAIYNNNNAVDINNELQLLALIKGDWKPKSKYQIAWIREMIIKYAPELSYDKYLVSDELIWDKATATLSRVASDDDVHTVS